MANRLKLTSTAVDRLNEHGIYWDTQEPGLGVRVSPRGKTYFYQRRIKGSGVERNVSLKRHGDPVLVNGALRTFAYGADDARAQATLLKGQMLAGIDPVAEERRKIAEAAAKAEQLKAVSLSFQACLDEYLEHHRVKGRPLRPKTKFDYRYTLERFFKKWLPLPVIQITRTMCDDRIREIETDVSRTAAHKSRVYLRMILNSAKTESGDPILPVNPVTRMVTKTHPPASRKRRIPAAKVGAVFSMLRQRAASPVKDLDRTAADWVTALLLTGWRATECAAMEWSWIDWIAKTIKLPGDMDPVNERGFAGTKTHAETVLPCSEVLFEILKGRFELEHRDGRYCFAGRSDNALPYITTAHGTMRLVSAAAGCKISFHDLRRTAVSMAIACRVDYGHRMQLLNHSSKSVHDDYERTDDPEVLRPAVNAIADHITTAAKVYESQQSGGNVITLADRRPA